MHAKAESAFKCLMHKKKLAIVDWDERIESNNKSASQQKQTAE